MVERLVKSVVENTSCELQLLKDASKFLDKFNIETEDKKKIKLTSPKK